MVGTHDFHHYQLSISEHSWGWAVAGIWPAWCVGPPKCKVFYWRSDFIYTGLGIHTGLLGAWALASPILHFHPLGSHAPAQTDLLLLVIYNTQFSATCQVAIDSSNQPHHWSLNILPLIPFSKLCDGTTTQKKTDCSNSGQTEARRPFTDQVKSQWWLPGESSVLTLQLATRGVAVWGAHWAYFPVPESRSGLS